jgi:HK97 family phage major capsid protein
MKLTFQSEVLTASISKREITGLIVPFGKVGQTSMGQVVFEQGSLNVSGDIKFLSEHDNTKPLGRMIAHNVTPIGIVATFKLANTTTAMDHLIEASEGLRSGLSVGANIDTYENKDGVVHVTKASLVEVSHVSNPAFSEAIITDVAATKDVASEEEVAASADDQTTTESEVTSMANPEEVTPEVQDAAPQVDAAVEASKVVHPAIFTKPRSPITSAASYLEHKVKASMGNQESNLFVMAADDTSATNTGLTLAPHMNEFVSTSIAGRPTIEALSSGVLPPTGLSFTIPKLTAVPTVADTDEAAAPSETGMTSDYLTVNVNKFAGRNEISLELIERSGPLFFNELVREMANAYALATDKAAVAALTAGGTQAAGVAATAAGLQSFVAVETAAAYKNSGSFARNLIASPDQWAAIMGYTDDNKRPLYVAANPANNSGSVSGQSVRGNVLGLDLYVDHGIVTSGIIDESAFIVAPEAATVYESPTRQVQVTRTTDGMVEIMLYGYLAIAVKKATGIRRFNLT